MRITHVRREMLTSCNFIAGFRDISFLAVVLGSEHFIFRRKHIYVALVNRRTNFENIDRLVGDFSTLKISDVVFVIKKKLLLLFQIRTNVHCVKTLSRCY